MTISFRKADKPEFFLVVEMTAPPRPGDDVRINTTNVKGVFVVDSIEYVINRGPSSGNESVWVWLSEKE